MGENASKGIIKKIFAGIGSFFGRILSGVTVSLGFVLALALFVYIFHDRIHDFIIPPNEVNQVNYSIESELKNIGEFVTQEYTYSGYIEETNTRKFPFWGADIPFTTNKVTVRYEGVIKAGYKVDDISVTVLDTTKRVYISLPDPIIISNEIDNVGYEEENNILNPISGDVANNMLSDVKAQKESEAIEAGLYENAEKYAKEVIKDKLAAFGDYSITFF